MRTSRLLVAALALAAVVLLPGRALATEPNDASATYQFVIDVTHHIESADGDLATLDGEGTFSVHPKSATGGGEFSLTEDGTTLSGTWEALELLSFQPYGCFPSPDDFVCGGKIELRVLLTTEGGEQLPAMVTIICTIPGPPNIPGQPEETRNATEGALLNVPGLENYNKQVQGAGANVYFLITTSDGKEKEC
jgi:hypothetical protein